MRLSHLASTLQLPEDEVKRLIVEAIFDESKKPELLFKQLIKIAEIAGLLNEREGILLMAGDAAAGSEEEIDLSVIADPLSCSSAANANSRSYKFINDW